MNFKELLGKQMLFFDGATGTQLQARGLQPGELPESWNFTHPDIVEAVHRSYLDVGSNIVKSNTFGANPLKLAGSGLDCKETIEAAVAIAKKACGGRENKFVALNLGPTGKLLAPYGDLPFEKAVEAYGEMVRYGAAAGADLILIETMSDTYEIKAAVLASKENSDLPICVTMTFDEDGKLLTGATVEAAALMCEGLGVDAIGFNCGLGPVQVGKLFPQMLAATSLPLIINPNAGLPVQRDGKTCFDVGPEEYAELMYELAGKGASIVGGCCGTTPEHIRGLHHLLVNNVKPPKKLMPAVYSPDRQSGCGQEAAEEKTELIQKLERGEKIFVVELDPPFDANDTKLMDGASLLRDIGVDMITLADSPLARPRADSIASAIKMRYTRQMEAMPHISCRDKNVIAHRAQLLGMHMNGLRHALIVTGDPIARGDRESIKSVFNFNSIKLMKYVQTMNQEVFGNRPIYYGGALNHNNGSADNIAARMRLKMEAGAQWFLTQPIYGQDDIDRLRELKEKSGGRIIAGIMPLVSRKNALFIKNEMPGIHVPEHVLEQYEEGMSREAYEDVAAAISVDLMKRLEDVCDGYYMMTPFNRASLIKRIILQAKKELR